MFKCIECNESMLKNTFICGSCERNKRTGSESHNTHLVRTQNCRSINMAEGSKDNEGSQYWDHATSHNAVDDAGDTIEHDQANPDYVSAKRLEELDRNANPPINENRARALALLQEGAALLTDKEKIAVQDFAKGVSQKVTAEKMVISQQAVAKTLKRGLNKLKKFCGGKL